MADRKCPECRGRMNVHKVSRVLREVAPGVWAEQVVCWGCGLRGRPDPDPRLPQQGGRTLRQRTKSHSEG